ncbi:MAG: pyridoxal 5'-phosphate synthase glutaminase subunit PdxT [Candidatus Delongbacteria bacterium]|nr:pyridoxal 5'-phosphate synthase glutaminase subunit PdxT [Candidatus Delongbacteria bacterium]
MKAAVLALQGDFEAHRMAIQAQFPDAEIILFKQASDVIDALPLDLFAIPGGESSAFSKLISFHHLQPLIRKIVEDPQTITLATCAGAILIASQIQNPGRAVTIPMLDVTIKRNAYGRQIDSFIAPLEFSAAVTQSGIIPESDSQREGVFIRAPQFIRLGPQVETLASEGGKPVLIRQGNILAATFHPELSKHSLIYRIIKSMIPCMPKHKFQKEESNP